MSSSFSYVDTYSVPNLRVTNQRVVTYKLVDFGDFLLYDRIEGVSGKPTTGLLGFLFRFLGDSQVLQSRFAIASDGLQIVKAHARWGVFHRSPIVTIQRNGKAEEGIDRARPELRQIEERLNQEIRIRYREDQDPSPAEPALGARNVSTNPPGSSAAGAAMAAAGASVQ